MSEAAQLPASEREAHLGVGGYGPALLEVFKEKIQEEKIQDHQAEHQAQLTELEQLKQAVEVEAKQAFPEAFATANKVADKAAEKPAPPKSAIKKSVKADEILSFKPPVEDSKKQVVPGEKPADSEEEAKRRDDRCSPY